MFGERIEAAKETLRHLLSHLPERSHFNIIKFGTKTEPFWPETKMFNKESHKLAKEAISKIEANMEGTELKKAVKFVYEEIKPILKRRNIYIITDGDIYNEYDECHELV